ncbi:trimeric intracellular cation channel family protein [Streptomyces sp. B3I8]|uniref:trimeric intracellular cation channel family protein n=1 Tax=Streptomyces sp. B3I8 TaxID=3042303 RepID=UPI002783D411|nr:TRIC cation channel family protein [Streptomyces sp. B3I8]MDQ0787875.1 putative membrane protein YeiH [Streptomyces sp. B3I8]
MLTLDLTGTFAFGLNGAPTAVEAARLDLVDVVVLGMITALGGGRIRDVLIDSLFPATLLDWRYHALARHRRAARLRAQPAPAAEGTIAALDASASAPSR